VTKEVASVIVKSYDAYASANGKEWADRHFLAFGTPRYDANLRLLEEARRVAGGLGDAEGPPGIVAQGIDFRY
jgi:hypothetical protein